MASMFIDTQLCGEETRKRSNKPGVFLFRLQIVALDAKIPFLCRM
jgi:hypothetical protein